MKGERNILVVDDDKTVLQIVSRIFEKRGYAVDVAETGREAEEKVDSLHHDLALIDVKLPDTDGIELMRKLQTRVPDMVNIVLTGFASIDNGVRALNSGADAYLVKPIGPEELIKIVDEKLAGKAKTVSRKTR